MQGMKTHSPRLSIAAGVLTIVAIVLVNRQFEPQYLFDEHPIRAIAIWVPIGGALGAIIFKLFRDRALAGLIFGAIFQALMISTLPCVY